jgi:hypothetical protein
VHEADLDNLCASPLTPLWAQVHEYFVQALEKAGSLALNNSTTAALVLSVGGNNANTSLSGGLTSRNCPLTDTRAPGLPARDIAML